MPTAEKPESVRGRRPATSRYRLAKVALAVTAGLLLTAGLATAPAQAAVTAAAKTSPVGPAGAAKARTIGEVPATLPACNTSGDSGSGLASLFTPLGPVRVMDTRNGTGGVTGPLGADATATLQVGGTNGIPTSGDIVVVLNVTVISPAAGGYLIVYPDGTTRPATSNINFPAGRTIANLVTVPVGTGGTIAFYNASGGNIQLAADIAGYYSPVSGASGSSFTPLAPARVMDTRNGTGGVTGPIGADATASLQIAGTGGIPASGVTAVVLNVTLIDPAAGGYLIVYPDGTTRPATSNIDFPAGHTLANLVTVPVGSDGKIDFYNASGGNIQLAADIAGYYSAGSSSFFTPLGPARVMDTRNGTGGVTGPVGANGTATFQVAGTNGIPSSGVTAVVLNVTAISPTAGGYLTVYPDGTSRPATSNIDFPAGQTIANLVTVPVGTDGKIDFHNASGGNIQLAADIAGYYDTNNTYEYFGRCAGTGSGSYRAIIFCDNGNAVFGVVDAGGTTESDASCRINNMNSIVNQQQPDWGLLRCSANDGTGTYQGYVNRHGDISWMLLNIGSGNIANGGTVLCQYNASGTDSFNPNAPL